ncbi:nucleotide exchange factor SIL1 [Lampris incognitus]|uniref:nucleotide exchange factor SIL1 n=1 Tax=Lampris incognitus TaxID=2546036 RepID=UPI0024B5A22A|nr:nucleotide exchange factor SIL1 [Lampris incognitus]XP_056144420.1 nucleotide exchange factor SIL1 [Lampris incognitus]
MVGTACTVQRASPSLTLLFFSLLHCCHPATCLKQKMQSESALIVVEDSGGGGAEGSVEDRVAEDDEEDLEVVKPTDQWQTLKPGQAVPAGSHVRLNLQTGQREVRLGESKKKYSTQKHSVEKWTSQQFNSDELKQALKNIKEDHTSPTKDEDQEDQDWSSGNKQLRSEDLRRTMAQLDLQVETDVQVMTRLLAQYNSKNSTMEQRLQILLELEYLVHQVDNAQILNSMGGLQIILQGLNSSDLRLQERSAFLLGSALARNPAVQVEAVKNGHLQKLLALLATPRPVGVKKKVLFAMSSLLHHFQYAQCYFLSHGGLNILLQLFRADGSGALQLRIITLLYDMITEKSLTSQANSDPAFTFSSMDHLCDYSMESLSQELLEEGWCSLVPDLLQSTEHDWREKGLQTLLAMVPVCLDQYRLDTSLSLSLGSLRSQYHELVRKDLMLGEEDSYFKEILDLLDTLELTMGSS